MRTDQDPQSRFEDRLLTELKRTIVERSAVNAAAPVARRSTSRRRRLVLAGAAGALAVGAGVVATQLPGPGITPTAAAYELNDHPDGTVTVTIKRLSDAEGLERKLEAAGIPAEVDYLRNAQCQRHRFTPAKRPGKLRIDSRGGHDPASFTVRPDDYTSGETLVLEAMAGSTNVNDTRPEESLMLKIATAVGPVAPCVPQ